MIAQRPLVAEAATHVMGVARFHRFFRTAASLDVHKQDLKRFSDFVNHKLYDLLVRGAENARANGRHLIAPFDLPITKGLQVSIDAFKAMDEATELEPILDQLTARPPLDLPPSEETEARLPDIVGGLGVALAHAFKIIDPDVKHPAAEHWQRSFHIFNLLL